VTLGNWFIAKCALTAVILFYGCGHQFAHAQAAPQAAPCAYNPVIVISRSVTAQGDMIRAQGESYEAFQQGNLNYARARRELAEAVDKDLDNWLKYVRTYFDRRVERERRKMELFEITEERKDLYAVQRENGRRRLMQTMMNDPELTGASIEQGGAMNKMLAQFYNTPIAYGIELGPTLEHELGNRLDLTPEILSAIRIQTSNSGGGVSQFKLNQSMSLDLSWWPDLLRSKEFDDYRTAVELQRERMQGFVGARVMVPVEIMDSMENAISELMRSFYKKNPPGSRKGMPPEFVRKYIRAEDFLTQLDRDMQRIRDTGQASAIGSAQPFDPVGNGKDLPSLLSWMIRSGLTFAPATPGDESIYRTVFTQMRELYIHVAE
jgi:hypothetical protein